MLGKQITPYREEDKQVTSYQWMIDELTDEIAFWEKQGMDKEFPNTFERMKSNLQKAKTKQDGE